MYYERTLSDILVQANKFFKVVLITGPRQVGKTTLFKKMREENRKYVTLDDANDLLLAQEDHVQFFEKYSPPVLIDGVQGRYLLPLLTFLGLFVIYLNHKNISIQTNRDSRYLYAFLLFLNEIAFLDIMRSL